MVKRMVECFPCVTRRMWSVGCVTVTGGDCLRVLVWVTWVELRRVGEGEGAAGVARSGGRVVSEVGGAGGGGFEPQGDVVGAGVWGTPLGW